MNPGSATHIWEEYKNSGTFPRGTRGLCPTSGSQSWRGGAPKHLAWKATGEYVQENHRAVGSGEPAPLLTCRLRDPSAKASVWKVLKPHVNTNLKASPGKAGVCWDSLRCTCWVHAAHTEDAPRPPGLVARGVGLYFWAPGTMLYTRSLLLGWEK